MTSDEYQNKRSWLIDTAETPADKKKLKSQVAALDAIYKAQKATKSTPSTMGSVEKLTSRVSNLGLSDRDIKNAKIQAAYNAKRASRKVWNNGMTN